MKELLLLPVNLCYKAPSVKVTEHRGGHQVEEQHPGVQGVHSDAARRWCGPVGY